MGTEDRVTVCVVLRPEGPEPSEPPTSETLHKWAPPAGALDQVKEWIAKAGLRVVDARFNNITVDTTPHEWTERVAKMPANIRALVLSMGTMTPPDFGPGGEFNQ
jgi:hypothetical protein